MTISVLNDDFNCQGIRIVSDLFEDFYDSEDGTLSLSYTLNCGEIITIDFSLEDDPITEYTIYNDDPTIKLCDGIYCFTLVHALESEDTRVVEYGMTYVDCDTVCRINDEYIKDRYSVTEAVYHEILKDAYRCTDCNCAKPCLIFAKLDSLLTGVENTISFEEYTKVSECVPCSKSKKS